MLPLLAAAIISTTVSNASTGGNVGQSGDIVNGSSYSSVSVQTYVNGNGGTSTVDITTDDNGQVNRETETKAIAPGGSAQIDVATSSGDSSVEVRSFAGSNYGSDTHASSSRTHASSTLSASTSAVASIQTPIRGFDFVALLHEFLGFWRFW